MRCSDCGTDLDGGVFYCTGCGRPVGFESQAGVATDDADLENVPGPTRPRERAPAEPSVESVPARRPDRALCSLCMGSFPESVLSRVDGNAYCPDCSPLSARRAEPEPRPADAGGHPGGRTTFVPPPMMRGSTGGGAAKKVVAALFVLILVGAAGLAAYAILGQSRIDKLVAGADTTLRPAKLLYHRYEAGERLTYGIEGRMEGTMETSGGMSPFGGGDEIIMDLTLGLDVVIDVLSVDSRGNAELQIAFEGGNLDGTLEMGGRPMPLSAFGEQAFGGLANEIARVTVDPFGRTIAGEMGGDMSGLLNGQFGAMPERNLKVGDEWTEQESIAIPGQEIPGFTITADYRVEGYKKIRGRDCMVISVNGDLSADSMEGLPAFMDVEFDVGMEGALFFDVEAGRMVKTAMDLAFDLEMSGGGNTVEANFIFQIDVDLK